MSEHPLSLTEASSQARTDPLFALKNPQASPSTGEEPLPSQAPDLQPTAQHHTAYPVNQRSLESLSLPELIDRLSCALNDFQQFTRAAAPPVAALPEDTQGEEGPSLAHSLALWNAPSAEGDEHKVDAEPVFTLSPIAASETEQEYKITPTLPSGSESFGPEQPTPVASPHPHAIADLEAFFADEDGSEGHAAEDSDGIDLPPTETNSEPLLADPTAPSLRLPLTPSDSTPEAAQSAPASPVPSISLSDSDWASDEGVSETGSRPSPHQPPSLAPLPHFRSVRNA